MYFHTEYMKIRTRENFRDCQRDAQQTFELAGSKMQTVVFNIYKGKNYHKGKNHYKRQNYHKR